MPVLAAIVRTGGGGCEPTTIWYSICASAATPWQKPTSARNTSPAAVGFGSVYTPEMDADWRPGGSVSNAVDALVPSASATCVNLNTAPWEALVMAPS